MMRSKLWIMLVMVCCLTVGVQAQEEMEFDPDSAEFDTEYTEDSEEVVGDAMAEAVETVGSEGESSIPAEVVMKETEVEMPCLKMENSEKILEVLKGIEGIDTVTPDFEAKKLLIKHSEKLDFIKDVLPKLKELDKDVKIVELLKTK
jgi:hypothetical protein